MYKKITTVTEKIKQNSNQETPKITIPSALNVIEPLRDCLQNAITPENKTDIIMHNNVKHKTHL